MLGIRKRCFRQGIFKGESFTESIKTTMQDGVHPLGEYTANIGIYDCLPTLDWFTEVRVRFWLNWAIRKVVKKDVRVLAAPRRPCIAEKTVRFSIVKRLED